MKNAEIIDGEFKEVAESTALAPKTAVAIWTPSFATSVDDAVYMKEQKNRFFREVMVEGQHYGKIPGVTKPSLFKPGAEMLLANMGLNPSFLDEDSPIVDMTGRDYNGEIYIRYRRQCRIYRQTGPREEERTLIAQASGSCNSWEPKYRYRNSALTCPECSKETIIKGKDEYGGGYICFAKKGGCGAKFKDRDPVITGQVLGKVANPDVAEIENTVLKMADKRALVAATLIATGCSDIFTQDVEDISQVQRQAPAQSAGPTTQQVYQQGVKAGLWTDGGGFVKWIKANVYSCQDAAKEKKLTLEQTAEIADAIRDYAK